MSKHFKTYVLPLSFLVVILVSICTVALTQTNQLTPQDDPYVTVKLRVSDWDKVIAIIHNAPVVGSERDPIINEIITQARIQLAPKPDSTKSDFNNKVDSARRKDAYKHNPKSDRKKQ